MPFVQIFELIKSAILPLAAIVVSILAWWHSKRAVYAGILSSGRLDWIKELRVKLGEFAGLLLEEGADRTQKLKQKKFEIETFLNYANGYPDYEKLRKALNEYITMPPENVNLGQLCDVSQEILSNCYKRAKFEAGITKRNEKKARRYNYTS